MLCLVLHPTRRPAYRIGGDAGGLRGGGLGPRDTAEDVHYLRRRSADHVGQARVDAPAPKAGRLVGRALKQQVCCAVWVPTCRILLVGCLSELECPC